jgi:hypothetical protein
MNGSHKRNETDALFRLFLLFKERTAGGTPALMPQAPELTGTSGAGAPLVPPAVETPLTPGAPIV